MSSNYLKKGSYNSICDRCGQKRKIEEMRREWTGLLTCTFCWDPRDLWTLPVPIPQDGMPVPNARPRPTGLSVLPNGIDISVWGGPYQDIHAVITSDVIVGAFDYIWGGNQNLPYNSTNFPLQ